MVIISFKLTPNNTLLTLTPISFNSNNAFYIGSSGVVTDVNGGFAYGVQPVAYLKSSVKIIENSYHNLEYGSMSNPFRLSVQN